MLHEWPVGSSAKGVPQHSPRFRVMPGTNQCSSTFELSLVVVRTVGQRLLVAFRGTSIIAASEHRVPSSGQACSLRTLCETRFTSTQQVLDNALRYVGGRHSN